MKLSQRLMTIAGKINKGETLADIGTDHGYLPLFLYESGICPKVIMADVSKGSLAKAEQSCKELFPGKKFDLRLGDGLDVLEPGEVDSVVIAGMGGILMSEILDWDLEKSYSINKFVLQPRNNVGALRKWLFRNGFNIIDEELVEEGKFICEIITVEPGENIIVRDCIQDISEDIIFEYPVMLVDRPMSKEQKDLTLKYFDEHLGKLNYIKTQIEKGTKGEVEFHQEYQQTLLRIGRIDFLKEILNSK